MIKTAIITGASGNGIGRSIAFTLARDGFNTIINYRSNKVHADEVCKFITSNGGNAFPIQANVFSQEECVFLVRETIKKFGCIDAIIIGPGADFNTEEPSSLIPEKSLQDIVQEISPLYYFLPLILPELKKSINGRIIGIASNITFPSPSYSYNVAKKARQASILELAKSCWKDKITVNVIAPGPLNLIQNVADAFSQSKNFPEQSNQISPQDIAELVSFLCSEKGRFITGNMIETYF